MLLLFTFPSPTVLLVSVVGIIVVFGGGSSMLEAGQSNVQSGRSDGGGGSVYETETEREK